MDAYKLMNFENVDEIGPRAPDLAVEITRDCRLTLK
jgi:hypothetical protein